MATEPEDTRSLQDVATDFGISYGASKLAEKELAAEKDVLYARLDERDADEKLAHKTVNVPIIANVTPDQWLETYYPGWRFANPEKVLGKVVIEEDPTLKKRTFVNPEDGMVYGRTRKEGNPRLDDERLRAEDPELWERITHEETTRALNDVEEISKADFAKMKKYFVPGKVTVALMTPRKAKADELDEAD